MAGVENCGRIISENALLNKNRNSTKNINIYKIVFIDKLLQTIAVDDFPLFYYLCADFKPITTFSLSSVKGM